MAVPALFNISLAVNCICVVAEIYFLISLTIHFKRLNNSSQPMQSQAQVLARWMTRGAFGACISSFPFYILFIIHYGSRTLDGTACLVTENLPVVFYAMHKMSTYMFIYFRVKTFEDFFSERGWRFLRLFAFSVGIIYFGIIFVILPFVSFSGLEQFRNTNGFCEKSRRQNENPIFFVFGAIIVLSDFVAAGVGIIAFIRVLFCSETLGRITRKDPQVAEAGRNVAIWSTVALTSTAVCMTASVATDWVVFTSVDVAINTFCICKQYPECLTALLWLIFGLQVEDAEEMNNAKEGVQTGVEGVGS